jgi:fused signal recognition particle receptor
MSTLWLTRLKQGLSRTRVNLAGLFSGGVIDDALFDDLETALIGADIGVATTTQLLERLRARVKLEGLKTPADVRGALRDEIAAVLKPCERTLDHTRAMPLVVMVAGVNGAGKTTSIGKLAHWFAERGNTVLLAAGDTFRAAAREQLAVWGSRNGVEVISQSSGDPAAVVFDAVKAAQARNRDVLMEELKRVRRALAKSMDGAPHEVLLVLDGTTGQNALAQVKAFDDAVGLTGLIVTKLDGTAKGGVLAAIASERARMGKPLSILFIGVGEQLEDLQPFIAEEFVEALIGAS